MRYCGVEITASPGEQQLVTLHERRAAGELELVATFYEPGSAERVARTIEGFGRGEAVVGLDALAGPPLGLLRPGAPARGALGLPDGAYDGLRVCDAAMLVRGLPAAPPPVAGPRRPAAADAGRDLFAALAPLGHYVPEAAGERYVGDVGSHPVSHGRVFETRPDAVFCALLGHRPSPERTPWGLQQRVAALKLKGVVDADGGLWHRSLSEVDACAAAYTAYAFAAGLGSWIGDPAEGVVVLPTSGLLERYGTLPPPSRSPLA